MPWNRKTTARDRKRRASSKKHERRQLLKLSAEYARLMSRPWHPDDPPTYATKAEFWNPGFEDLVFEDFDEAKHVLSRVIEVVFRAPEGHHIAYTRLGPDEPMVPIVVKDRAHGVIYGYKE